MSPIVVVPDRPGPLISVPSGRSRDELDDVIDELLPDTDEGPGWFDVALLVLGVGLIGWAVAGAPTLVLVLGVIATVLGCVLPARSLWRRVQRGRRSAALARGIPLRVSDPAIDRLVRAYSDLLALAPTLPEGTSAIAAAHSALVEVATLLNGQPLESPASRDYATQRAASIERLTEALRSPDVPDTTLRAREELEPHGGFNSLTRLDDLTAELRTRRAR